MGKAALTSEFYDCVQAKTIGKTGFASERSRILHTASIAMRLRLDKESQLPTSLLLDAHLRVVVLQQPSRLAAG